MRQIPVHFFFSRKLTLISKAKSSTPVQSMAMTVISLRNFALEYLNQLSSDIFEQTEQSNANSMLVCELEAHLPCVHHNLPGVES